MPLGIVLIVIGLVIAFFLSAWLGFVVILAGLILLILGVART